MASSLDYVKFVAEQLSDAGEITYKKMFGEYGVYCNGIYFAAICDDRFLVKITDGGRKLMPDCETQLPYEGGKPMFFITEVDDSDFLKELARVTCSELPMQRRETAKR